MRSLLVLIAGALLPLGFAPFELWPVVILSPLVLLWAFDQVDNPRSAFLVGWIYGLGYLGVGVSWVYNSLHVFGRAPVMVAGGLTLLLILFLALYIGLVMWLLYRLQLRHGKSVIWTLPLFWFAMEWMKGWLLTGFPWLSLGYAHVPSPLAGFAPLLGIYGLSAISLLLSLLLYRAIQTRGLVWLIPVALVGATGWLIHPIEWTHALPESLRVAQIQGNIDQHIKWRRDQRGNIINTYWTRTREVMDHDLIVWPEAAIPGRKQQLQASILDPLTAQMKQNDSHLLTGILVTDVERNGYYNSMLLLGQNSGEYHKRHLVPFGEYYPFRELLDFMKQYIHIPRTDTLAGADQQTLMQVKDHTLGISICYEDVFSRDINRDLPMANLLVNTSNDAWFGDSLAPHQHLQIAQMRSLETGRPMVRATNTGKSAFIDHKGNIISTAEQFIEATLSAEMTGRTGSTPFLYFERIQGWLAALMLSFAIAMVFKPRVMK